MLGLAGAIFPPVPNPELDDMSSTQDLPAYSTGDREVPSETLPHNGVMDSALAKYSIPYVQW